MRNFEYIILKCIEHDGKMRPKYRALVRTMVEDDEEPVAIINRIDAKKVEEGGQNREFSEIQNWLDKDKSIYLEELASQGWKLLSGPEYVYYPDEADVKPVDYTYRFYRFL